MSFPPKPKTSYIPPQKEDRRPPAAKEPPHHPLLRLVGQEIIIKQRNGQEIRGKLIDYREGLLKVAAANVLFTKDGRSNSVVNVEWVLIDRSAVAMIAPATGDGWLDP